MRRSIDDHTFDPLIDPVLAADPDVAAVSWVVAIADDYDDGEPRVVVSLEEVGRPGQGHSAHMLPLEARRLRNALRAALVEIGEDPGA